MTRRRFATLPLFWLALALGAQVAWAGSAPRMGIDDLLDRLGRPGLTVIDTRLEGDWGASEGKVAGALRRDPDAVASWADELPRDGTLVVYCA